MARPLRFDDSACGTNAGYSRHRHMAKRDPSHRACGPCRMAHNEYQAAWRESGATGVPRVWHGRKPDPGACGSMRGYWTHQRRREEVCWPCRVAAYEYGRALRRARKEREAAGLADMPHGKRNTYQAGCKCTPCRRAESRYRAAWRARTGR